jgi:4-carboxymuconolactone decarboxylase
VPRLPRLQRDECSPEQQHAYDTIMRCRPGVGGPFIPLIRNPALAERVALLGEHLRFHGLLPAVDRELAVLTLSRELGSVLEWVAHVGIARKEGAREEAIAAIHDQLETSALEPREALVIEVARALLRRHVLDDELYRRGEATFGIAAWVELITLLGFYVMIAFLIHAFEIEPPAGVTLPAWSDATSP